MDKGILIHADTHTHTHTTSLDVRSHAFVAQNSENREACYQGKADEGGRGVQKFCANKSRRRRRGQWKAVAESAFNRELLFKARDGLRQKTTLKVDQLFSIGLLLSFLAAIILLTCFAAVSA